MRLRKCRTTRNSWEKSTVVAVKIGELEQFLVVIGVGGGGWTEE